MSADAEASAIEVGDAAATVLQAAYRYALVDSLKMVEGGLLSIAAARNDERARRYLGRQAAEGRTSKAYRADRRDVNDAGYVTGAAAPALREARWRVLREKPGRGTAPGLVAPQWSYSVGTALVRAAEVARSSGAIRVDVPHLLLELVNAGDRSVQTLFDRISLDAGTVREKISEERLSVDAPAFTPLINSLRAFGAVDVAVPWVVRWIPRAVARMSRQSKWGGPVMPCLEHEAMRQAVLMGHARVSTASALLAVCILDAQLEESGHRLLKEYLPYNQGGEILAEAGVKLGRARAAAEPLVKERETHTASESSERFWGNRLADPVWSIAAAEAMDQSAVLAQRLAHRSVGTLHLLAAVIHDDASSAVRLLQQLGIDVEQVRQRTEARLAQALN